jgi:DNA-binding PadR family transcriptional regulator
MDFDRHLPLAPRDLLILSVLAEGPLHGYGIIKAVEARSQSGVYLDPANLYRALRRMRKAGWIREGEPEDASGTASEGAEAKQEGRKGPGAGRRKTHEISKAGRGVLAAELARLDRLLRHARPALAKGEGR